MSSGTDIFAIANACLSIRESYKTLEQCQKILKLKKWDSEELKYEFENGIKFGLGKYISPYLTKMHIFVQNSPNLIY